MPAFNDLTDTTDIIHHSFSESMRTSLQTLRDLETRPSCYKVAAASLIHSCSTLDGSFTPTDNDIARGADFIIHDEISIYAARLAVCELSSAKASIPPPCKAFVPTIKTVKKTSWAGYLTSSGPTKPPQLYPEYDELTEQSLEQCLNALHSSNQAWTSFTSSKQNAAIMCHSMPGEIERDREIHLHKILSTVTENVVISLHNSKEDWQQFKAGFNELASNMRQTHLDLMDADEQRLEAARRIWAQWQADIEHISHGVQQIRTDVDQAHDSLQEYNQHVRASASQISGQFTNLAMQQRNEMQAITMDAEAFKDMILYVKEQVTQGLIKSLLDATHNLTYVNAMVSHLNHTIAGVQDRVDTLSDTADRANDKFDKLNTRFERFLDIFNGDWRGISHRLETAAAFAAYTAVYSLLSVGFWQQLAPFPGNVCAALATGLVLAYISTIYYSPIYLVTQLLSLLTTYSPILAGVASFVILALACLNRLRTGCWLPRRAHHSPISRSETVTHKTFSLPINDPRYVAQMVERQIQRETSAYVV